MVNKICVPLLGILCVIFSQSAPAPQYIDNYRPWYLFRWPSQIVYLVSRPQPLFNSQDHRRSDPTNFSSFPSSYGVPSGSNSTKNALIPDDLVDKISRDPETPKPAKQPRGRITVYPFNNRRGVSQKFMVFDSCVRLPKNWQDRVASVNTHDTCVQLCEKTNCRGKCVKVQPGSPSHNRLRDIDWDSRTASLKRC